jgi:hypothetical protein
LGFGFPEPHATRLVKLFQKAGGLLKIIGPSAYERLQIGGNVNGFGLATASLAQAERKMASPVV